MSFSDFDPFAKKEKTHPVSGPYAVCDQEREDIIYSIAHHNHSTPRNPDRKLIPLRYLEYLKKRAGM